MKVNPHRNIDELFDSLPEEERIIANILREIVRENLPDAREKLSWGAPFYHGKRSICFIWPASIPWGKLDAGVALGFARADALEHNGFLGKENRKQIGRHVFLKAEEINVELITDLLQQALAFDQSR